VPEEASVNTEDTPAETLLSPADNGVADTATEGKPSDAAPEDAPATRPEYIPEKFWSDERGIDTKGLGAAYLDLEKQVSERDAGIPEDGVYASDLTAEMGIDAEDEKLSEYTELARKHRFTQEMYDDGMRLYLGVVDELEGNARRERELLGPGADNVIGEVNRWLGKLVDSKDISVEEANALVSGVKTADGVRALQKIRNAYRSPGIPDTPASETSALRDREDLDAMVADKRYGVDMIYTRRVEDAFKRFFDEDE